PARTQVRRLLVTGGAGLVALVGHGAVYHLQAPVARAAGHRAEGLILDVVSGLELADIEDPVFQDRLAKALSASTQQTSLIGTATSMGRAGAGAVAALATMGAQDRALVPLGLLGALPQVLSGQWAGMRGSPAWARPSRERWHLRWTLTTSQSAHELRLFGLAPVLRQRFDALSAEEVEVARTGGRAETRRSLLALVATRAVGAPTAGRSLLGLSSRRLSVADAAGSGLAARQLTSGVVTSLRNLTQARQAAATVADYSSLVRPPKGRRLTGPEPRRDFREIVVDDVHFAYRGSERAVLDGVSLRIGRGEVVALVGENGCGKTTLAKLLCCLYRPTAGTISWDDVDINGCEPGAVRAHISAVFQDFVRFTTLTAAENIGLGRPDRMHDRVAIERAATDAGADRIIAGLPGGYETVLSRDFGGVNLSTGQWQRVALARAFLRDAPFVVLDEPTAALDPRAERALFESVARLYRDRSALLISHRLSSVRFADRICVLDGGRITETGTHDDLVAAAGTYAELFDLQARAYR
ncbi:MAG: ABC transporter ATP-binding protein, partial [Acidimicrobiales bacterium]